LLENLTDLKFTDYMERMFAPGCALMLYKPHLADKLHVVLERNIGSMKMLLSCCRNEPAIDKKTEIINICPGCDKRFRNNYSTTTTISLWEILAESDYFPFPDYMGKTMSVIDACPTRDQPQIHDSIRKLLKRMNIILKEPARTRSEGTCCGDTFYGSIPVSKVKEQMVKRSAEMPVDDVVVYCVSCSKSVFIGGKRPHYMVDLLFNEETIPKTYEPDEWHRELDEYINIH
jgi:Fe-S oxidoreductase